MKYFLYIFMLVFILFSSTLAQGLTAVPFLGIQPSPELNGMAGAYTAVPTHSAYGLYYNPAQVGAFSTEDIFSIEYCNVEWLPAFHFSDLYFRSAAGAAGYDLSRSEVKLPIQLGIGFMHGYFDLGENVWTDEIGNVLGTFHSYERFNAISVGIQWDWLVQLSLGIGAKNYYSKLSPVSVGNEENQDGTVSGWAFDMGVLARFPIFENWPLKIASIHKADFFPVLDLNLGLAQLNAGEKVKYIDRASADPLPLTAKIGISVEVGLDMRVQERRLNMFSLIISSEANDLLIIRDDDYNKSYDLFPGDINPHTHVLRARSDSKVINRHGYRIDLLETLYLSYGNFSGAGFSDTKTAGYRISSRGLAKFFGPTIDRKWLQLFMSHLDLAYNFSQYENEGSPLSGTTFKSFSLNIFGF